jgi:hypothetical protein
MGFGNLVRQRGKETYKLKLTNKNYKYYNGLESGKQVVGPVSAQTLVDWRLGECGNKFIGVYTDFFFYLIVVECILLLYVINKILTFIPYSQ